MYEYRVKAFTETEGDAVEFLNEMAGDGWEYVEGLYEGHPPLDVLFRRLAKKSPTKTRTQSKKSKVRPASRVARRAKSSADDC
jgi:hypothetical protein